MADIWFDSLKSAVYDTKYAPKDYAGPIIPEELWWKYNHGRLGIDYDIRGNEFVQLNPPEFVEARYNAQKRIWDLMDYLSSTDYVVTKYLEGVMSEEDYLPIKQKRIDARAEINKLQGTYSLQ